MGENNGGYTLHINITEAQYNALRALINVSPNTTVRDHVIGSASASMPFRLEDYGMVGDILWEEIKRVDKEPHGTE